MDRREPPHTEEGWYALHDLRRIDWDAWRAAPEHERARALEEATAFLRAHEDLEDAAAGGSAVFSILGHKADLLVLHLRPTTAHLDRAERGFEQTAFAGFTERASSYVSVTEVSGYVSDALKEGDGVEAIEDTGTRRYIESRLYPSIVDAEHVCFYPMDKKRGPEDNWYDLPFAERADHLSSHGDIGRKYAGKVTQIISGSVGFDDYEWGVTLFADDPTDIKHLLYEMRFDPSTSRFAEFGPFYFGRRIAPEELPALLAGEAVGRTDAAASAAPEGDVAPHAHADGGPEDDESERDDASGGRPPVEEAPHEEISTEEFTHQLHGVGVDLAEYPDAGYGLAFTSTEDAEALAETVDGLRANFEHYDTHLLTTVRAEAGHSTVVSLWKNQRAADVASGFLGDLPGVETGVGAPLSGEGAAEDAEATADADAASRPHGTDSETDLRAELADRGVYAGQPHGEDVWAMVLYSEADPDELTGRVADLRDGFDRYDTHVKTALYENEGDGRAAIVSLWQTESAAGTAGEYLADLPGIVARAGEESGFGTMGMFYTVKPEYREEFVDTFGELGGLLAEMDGHLETDLLVNRDDENDMFIASQWRSREDALGFFRSDAFRDTVQWGREVLADRPRHVFLA
jgi:chlorite dismutase/heme-degrading monooxygenase HmoA